MTSNDRKDARVNRHHVVVVGAGFGGLETVRALAGAPVRITMVDRRNHHLFQPLLYQVATASLAPSEIAWPIRYLLRERREVTTVLASVEAVDKAARCVTLDDGSNSPLRDARAGGELVRCGSGSRAVRRGSQACVAARGETSGYRIDCCRKPDVGPGSPNRRFGVGHRQERPDRAVLGCAGAACASRVLRAGSCTRHGRRPSRLHQLFKTVGSAGVAATGSRCLRLARLYRRSVRSRLRAKRLELGHPPH